MITEQQIRARAYDLWLKNPELDLPEENWYEAERQLEAEEAKNPTPPLQPAPEPVTNPIPTPVVVPNPVIPGGDVPVPTLPTVPPVVVPVLPGTPQSGLPESGNG